MLKSEAAAYLAGVTQTEGAEASAPTNLHVITGEVGEASADGKTLVKIDGLMFSESDDQFIEVDALGGLEEGDIATIVLTGEQGHAMTPLALGSIGSVDRITVRIAAIEADYIKVEQLDAAEARIGDLEADHVSVDDLNAATARIGTLETTRATITDLEAATARIHSLEVDHVTVDNFEAATARIGELESDHVSTDDLEAATGRIGQLEADTADIDTIRANSAKVQNLTAAQLEADHATIGSLDTNYAHITNGVIDNATIGYADVNNLSAHYAEIQNGKINSALIDTAAIVDEQVFTVTGNKATISQLNADHINVRSINVKDLTVETANGYVNVGGKQTPTKELLDSIKDELQQEIDGAVETFTSSAVPLLNNYPASDWIISGATEEEQRKAYAKHIGDICYVQNSALDQNGYAYRFAYDSTEQTFKWVLIKDSDVTKALGDISDLKTFESETTTWMEETDEGLTTIRQNHTTLSGVVDKTVVETKQLWFTKSNTTAPNKPTAQVTSTSTAGNAWRVVVPAYNASYPNYYYCLQYKLADGTYAWSDVVRDIAMGESQQQGRKGVADAAAAQSAAETADGKAVTAQNTADSAVTAASTADGKAVAAQTTANANIKSSVQLWFTKANTTAPNKPAAQVTVNDASKTNQWNLAIPTYSASYPNYFYCYQQQKGDGTWQWTDVVYDRSITEAQAKAQASLPSSEFNTFKTTTFKELVDEVDEQSSTISTLSETVSTKADSSTVTTLSNTVNTVKQTADTNKTSITNLTKTVSDNKTAIETRASTIEQNLSGITTRVGKTESELDTVSNPNLTPYFSQDISDNDYWYEISSSYWTTLQDGWAHCERTNSGSSTVWCNYYVRLTHAPSDLKPSSKYTFLIEWRNATISGTNVQIDVVTDYSSLLDCFAGGTKGTVVSGTEGSAYVVLTTLSDLSTAKVFTRGYVSVPVNSSFVGDIRISVYEGEYSGPYKPYVDQTISNRVKSAETSIEQTANNVLIKATQSDITAAQGGQHLIESLINVAPSGVKIAASKVEIDGTAVFNAAKSKLDAAYDAKGAAATAESNAKNYTDTMPSYKVISTTYNYSLSQWLEYAAEGYQDSWSQAKPVKVGDTVLIKGTASNTGEAVYLLATVDTIGSSNQITKATSHGLIDPTAGQRADSIQVGGRNLLTANDALITPTLYGAYDLYVTDPIESGQSYILQLWDVDVSHSAKTAAQLGVNVYYCGGSMALGGWIGTNYFTSGHADHLILYFTVYTSGSTVNSGGNISGSANVLSHSSVTNTTKKYIRLYNSVPSVEGTRNMTVGSWKLEKGNKATDWTPAPEDVDASITNAVNDISVGGRNLLQDSDQVLVNGSVLDTKTLFACYLWSTPAKSYTGYKQIMPNTNVNSTGRFVLTFEAMDVSQEYWCIKHNGTKHDYTLYFKNSVDVEQGDVLTLSFNVAKFNPSVANGLEIKNFKLEKGNKATDWTPAPEDTVKRTQRIWYRTNGSSAPATPGTASSNWVTKADDGNDAWTKMHIAINSTHKYIYTCEQYEMANGTVGYTSVLLDNTITVIDGGNIITGSVMANKLNAANINASKTLTVGAMTDAAASTILNSNVQVGGRNLLLWSGEIDTYSAHSAVDRRWDFSTIYGTFAVSGNIVTFTKNASGLTNNTSGIRVSAMLSDGRKATEANLASLSFGLDLKLGDTLTFSCDVKTSGNRVALHAQHFNGTNRWAAAGSITEYGEPSDTDWHRYSYTFTVMSNYVSLTALGIYCELKEGVTISARNFKLERGNKATDWTPAPEDMAASVNQTYIQNLTPYFQMDMTQASDEYWANLTYARFSRLSDGWAHFEYNNTGSSTVNSYIGPKAISTLLPGGNYTLLAEFRNVVISGATNGSFYSQQISNAQIWGTEAYGGFSITNAQLIALENGEGKFYKSLTLLDAESKDPSGTVRGTLPKTIFMTINQQVAGSQSVSYDIRLSLYEGTYTGPYKPYSGDVLFATNTALTGTNESLEGAIADIGELSDQLVDTTTEQNKTITDIQKYLNSLRQDLDAEIQSRQQWLNFNSAEGLIIGATGSTFKTVTTNTSQQFRSGGTILAETSGTEFVAPVMRSDQLLIGNWMWTRRDNGNLSLKWIG